MLTRTLIAAFILSLNTAFAADSKTFLPLTSEETQWLGERIYQNECAAKPIYLTHWGKGEHFPSFGIGHFIWYVDNRQGIYQQTFAEMMNYVDAKYPAPSWLKSLQPFYAPWKTKAEFDAALHSPKMQQLRQWLLLSKTSQAEFIVKQFHQRFNQGLNKLGAEKNGLNGLSPDQYQLMAERMMAFKKGRFALIDYVNFKGIGNPKEQYQGQQWGLLSVMKQLMTQTPDWAQLNDSDLLAEFIKAAKQRLQLRVELAPSQRNEQRWLKGWFVRLDGYLNDGYLN